MPLRITSYEYVRTDYYYDLTVPIYENYEHCQLIHHNSATFTPKGPTHWTYDVFATGRPNTQLFRSTTGSNPFNPPDFEATLREQYGETLFADQELGGEFVAVDGAEFPVEWLKGEDLFFTDWPENPVLKVVALDPSKGTSGHGGDDQAHALVATAIEDGRYVYYVDADLRREAAHTMAENTIALCRAFSATGRPVDRVFCEDNATMGLMHQSFEAAILKCNYPVPYTLKPNTDRKELRIITQCGPPLSKRQLRFRRTPGARKLVAQLQTFPLGEHDDGPDALASALRCTNELLQWGKVR